MADEVSIRFTADISSLQDGMRQAASAVQTASAAIQGGAEQINSNFASIPQAYANTAAQKLAVAQSSNDSAVNIARQSELTQYSIALAGREQREALEKEIAQARQVGRKQELSDASGTERQKESFGLRHLQFIQSTLQQSTSAYEAAQRHIDGLASQSSSRRIEIERAGSNQICNDYKRSFQQIGSGFSSAIMGMITGHMRLRDAAQNVLTHLIQIFVQTRTRMVADWLAGVAQQTAGTQAGEGAKTTAVLAGVSARTSAESAGAHASMAAVIPGMLRSIAASAAETFAGIFGFLSPVMGPAAAGPAAAGEAAVLSAGAGLASFATGVWELPRDMIAQIHKGEMIVPAGPAAALRTMLGSSDGPARALQVHHSTHFNVSAIDAQGVRAFLKNNAQAIMRTVNEGVRAGAHLGLSKLTSL